MKNTVNKFNIVKLWWRKVYLITAEHCKNIIISDSVWTFNILQNHENICFIIKYPVIDKTCRKIKMKLRS